MYDSLATAEFLDLICCLGGLCIVGAGDMIFQEDVSLFLSKPSSKSVPSLPSIELYLLSYNI